MACRYVSNEEEGLHRAPIRVAERCNLTIDLGLVIFDAMHDWLHDEYPSSIEVVSPTVPSYSCIFNHLGARVMNLANLSDCYDKKREKLLGALKPVTSIYDGIRENPAALASLSFGRVINEYRTLKKLAEQAVKHYHAFFSLCDDARYNPEFFTKGIISEAVETLKKAWSYFGRFYNGDKPHNRVRNRWEAPIDFKHTAEWHKGKTRKNSKKGSMLFKSSEPPTGKRRRA